MLLARYIAEFSMLYPAALLCYLPLSGFLRLHYGSDIAFRQGKD